jgi:hypothetical protein
MTQAMTRSLATERVPIVVEGMHPREERIPDFLVIGAMKAGTTSLYHYLAAHPDVFMASVKELDFFVETANWRRGLNWYARQFNRARGAAAAGEASTAYSKHPIVPGVPERIATVIPRCKMIYVLRDPIDRIRSHYQHRVAIGSERARIEDAVIENPIYVACSRYASQIERYLDHFPREQLLLITAENLRGDRAATMRRVFGFIGVDEEIVPATLDTEYYRTAGRAGYPPIVGKLRHALKYVPAAKRAKEFVDSTLPRLVRARHADAPVNTGASMPSDTRLQLIELLHDDVERLGRYLPEGTEGWSVDPRGVR